MLTEYKQKSLLSLTAGELENEMTYACQENTDYGNETVKFILEHPELKKCMSIHIYDEFLFFQTYKDKNYELMQYYLFSPTLKDHANIENIFSQAYRAKKFDLLIYLIKDLKIELSPSIKELVHAENDTRNDQIKNLIDLIELNGVLEEVLDTKNIEKRIKI